MATKRDFYDNGIIAKQFDSTTWHAQSFTPVAGYVITEASVQASRQGSTAATLTLELQGSSGGEPDGISLSSGTLSAVSIAGDYTFKKVAMTPYVLIDAIEYWLVCKWSLNSPNHSLLGADNQDRYAGGICLDTTNSGGLWTNADDDLCFEIWGNDVSIGGSSGMNAAMALAAGMI